MPRTSSEHLTYPESNGLYESSLKATYQHILIQAVVSGLSLNVKNDFSE